ncbi:MAG: glycosyltransferase family 39 protein [Gemmatimonadetes bacterium]|nr:glycosyltransferase family 39 protein [Gemmatimonadota bacterium]
MSVDWGARVGPDERKPARHDPGSPFARRPVLLLAGFVVAVHVLVNLVTPYGIHRDELLYLAMGRHLQLFRMDFPPFIALLAEASRLLGDSLAVIRLGPAIAHGATTVLAAACAARWGGGRFAQLLAAGTVAAGPLFLRPGALFHPVAFDQLWWTAGLLVLSRIPAPAAGESARALRPQGRRWLLLGLVLGVGLLTKFSIGFIGIGMVAAVLLTPLRRWLLTPWPWLALLVGLLVGSPSLAGQVALGFPFFGQMQDLGSTQLERIGYRDFLLGQIMLVNFAALLALLGIAYLFHRGDVGARAVAWSCVVAFTTLLLLRGKPYYAGPVYPALFGAGAAALDAWTSRLRHPAVRRVVLGTAASSCVGLQLLLLPLGLPILPPRPMAEYARGLGIAAVTTTNVGEVLALPQDYADMLGWEAQAAAGARVYRALPPADRVRAVLVADNYGEAGAIDFFGPRYGLPPAMAPVGSYWFWGPGELPGDVVIKLRGERSDLLRFFRRIQLAAVVNEPWVVPEERHVEIWVCRDPYGTLAELWPRFRGQN